ncbi:MAG: SPOCS domain-containing protein [Clostridium sp.]
MKCCRKCKDSDPTINIRNKPCSNSILTTNWKQINVSETIYIPEGCPSVGNILNVNILAQVVRSNVVITPDSVNIQNAEGTGLTGYKVVINGVLIQTIIYEGIEDGKLFTVKNEAPFSTFVIMDSKYDFKNNTPCVSVCIEDILVSKIDCREILKNVAVLIQIK